MIVVRYADDLVAGFEHEDDARRFLDAMRERVKAFSLSLHPGKTRVIEFGRHAAVNLAGDPSNFSGRPDATACGQSSRKSRGSYDDECTRLSQLRVTG